MPICHDHAVQVVAVWSSPVRYAECDQQGIVFNAHYLTWCDEAAAAWLGAVGVAYDALLARGLDNRIVASSLTWAASARWGDTVEVDVATGQLGRSRYGLELTVRVGDRTCCTVVTTYVMTDAVGHPVPVPDDLRAVWPAG